ncbi:type ISP restriction/modification enzyme [Campylobacter helveticus]|uniref:type ISP restriction/modification enzyme n=1 Tax=Campylobacter helveticus TaxID=28898 RepID=UPI00104F20B0|nr:type ISP restriction/modification enzyme [Campylobacter helveticus]QBL11040.1 DNA methyltransferase [Campylobacter helveticus]
MEELIKTYQKELLEIRTKGSYSEYSFRTPLQNLLNTLKDESLDLSIIQESLSKDEKGVARADFDVYKRINSQDKLSYNALVGFVECKNINVDLKKELKSEQLSRYSQLCPNILLTNYRQFILLSYDRVIQVCELFDKDLNLTLFSESQKQVFLNLISDFYGENHANIKSKAELVKVLSTQSFYLSTALHNAYEEWQKQQNIENQDFFKSFKLVYDEFTQLAQTNFDEFDFCDLIAQSVVYGLFVSFVENDDFKFSEDETQNFISYLPKNFKTLSEIIYLTMREYYLSEPIKQVLKNIQKVISLLDKPTMAKFLNLELEQIAIYLYEDFIKAYDWLKGTQKRKEGGVFYTPKPVVNCIVSVLDELLRAKFDKKGFSEDGVKVLDFACGTGSFLASVCEKILEQQSCLSQNESFKKAVQNEAIKEKFLKEIYGFELSFVPYIVARLKLRQILKKKGYANVDEADFQIYLNNTLDLSENQEDLKFFLNELKNENEKAKNIKHNKNLLVILGNPPYNAKSKNKGKEILKLLKTYKENLNETNIQPLDDDYIKFMRFAQWKLLEQGSSTGLMGFITNNSFLDGRIHRKMRESLYKSFDEIYILNLHGSDKDAKNDENVFSIKVGVCISLFVKYKTTKSEGAKLYYYSTSEAGVFKRAEKFVLLELIAQNGLNAIKWEELSPEKPYFWFVPKSFDRVEYEDFWALASNRALGDNRAVFSGYSSGVNSRNDNLLIQLNFSKIKKMVEDMQKLSEIDIIKKYNPAKSWRVEEQRINFKNAKDKDFLKIAYRPFDTQFIFYPLDKINKIIPRGDDRKRLMQHFLIGENLGICFEKGINANNVAFVSDKIIEGHCIGSRTYIAPLYLYDINGKTPNFTPEFLAYKEKHKILKDKNEEQILAFIYANLYNPKYRSKYLEYLKIGFPKVSFEVSVKEFERFEKLGSKLIKLHLMQEIPEDNIDFEGDFAFSFIEKRQESERFKEDAQKKGRIILNEKLSIIGISREVWDYTIGGYQVIKQWLKYRKEYQCSKDELLHLLKICKILNETLQIQKALDEI